MSKLKVIKIVICEDCLNGIGKECHNPCCALWLHKVDLPIHEELYEVVEEYDPPKEFNLDEVWERRQRINIQEISIKEFKELAIRLKIRNEKKRD